MQLKLYLRIKRLCERTCQFKLNKLLSLIYHLQLKLCFERFNRGVVSKLMNSNYNENWFHDDVSFICPFVLFDQNFKLHLAMLKSIKFFKKSNWINKFHWSHFNRYILWTHHTKKIL